MSTPPPDDNEGVDRAARPFAFRTDMIVAAMALQVAVGLGAILENIAFRSTTVSIELAAVGIALGFLFMVAIEIIWPSPGWRRRPPQLVQLPHRATISRDPVLLCLRFETLLPVGMLVLWAVAYPLAVRTGGS